MKTKDFLDVINNNLWQTTIITVINMILVIILFITSLIQCSKINNTREVLERDHYQIKSEIKSIQSDVEKIKKNTR